MHHSSAPVARHVITDLDEASHVMGGVYAPNRMFGSRGDGFALELVSRSIPRMDIGRAAFRGDFGMQVPGSRNCYVVLNARHGGVTVGDGQQSVRVSAGKAAVLPPDLDLRYEDWTPGSEFATLRFEPSVFAECWPLVAAGELPSYRGLLAVDLLSESAQSFAWAMELVVRELRRPSGVLDNVAMAERVSELAISGLLMSLTGVDEASAGGTRAVVVRRAVSLLNDDARLFCSTTQVARELAVSVRTLQTAFQHELAVSPSEYLRRRRAAGARRELERHGPSGTTVEAVAHRWGFTNYGRFARLYRSLYGEGPAETLRRSRG